jgi:hypothetical protein
LECESQFWYKLKNPLDFIHGELSKNSAFYFFKTFNNFFRPCRKNTTLLSKKILPFVIKHKKYPKVYIPKGTASDIFLCLSATDAKEIILTMNSRWKNPSKLFEPNNTLQIISEIITAMNCTNLKINLSSNKKERKFKKKRNRMDLSF